MPVCPVPIHPPSIPHQSILTPCLPLPSLPLHSSLHTVFMSVHPSLSLSHSFSNHPSHWFPIPLSIPPSPHCLSPFPSVTYCFYLPRHPPIHSTPSAVPVTSLHLSPACPPFHSSWCSAQSSRLKGPSPPPPRTPKQGEVRWCPSFPHLLRIPLLPGLHLLLQP